MAEPCPTSDPQEPEVRPVTEAAPRLTVAPSPTTEPVTGKAETPAAKAPTGRIHYRRVWLNRPGFHGSAHIIASVALSRDEDGVDITASFLLSDCTRNVTLDLDMWTNSTAAARRNTLRKARLLRESVVAFCDAIEAANAEYEADRARNRRRPRKRNRS